MGLNWGCKDGAVVKMKLKLSGIYKNRKYYSDNIYFDLKISPIIQLKKTLYLNEYLAGITYGNLSASMKNMFVAATIDGKILIIDKNGKIIKSWQTRLRNGNFDSFFYNRIEPAKFISAYVVKIIVCDLPQLKIMINFRS